jgi:hypothetical protein
VIGHVTLHTWLDVPQICDETARRSAFSLVIKTSSLRCGRRVPSRLNQLCSDRLRCLRFCTEATNIVWPLHLSPSRPTPHLTRCAALHCASVSGEKGAFWAALVGADSPRFALCLLGGAKEKLTYNVAAPLFFSRPPLALRCCHLTLRLQSSFLQPPQSIPIAALPRRDLVSLDNLLPSPSLRLF